MTALPNAMATRNRFLTTAKALERALRQAEFDRPATDSAPFLVVRMGNSRVVGAPRGVGRGFLEGAAAVARGAGGLHGGGGEGAVVVIAVFVAVMIGVGAVNAVIEGVKGSQVAAPVDAALRVGIARVGFGGRVDDILDTGLVPVP